ncbi:MAG: peptide chain release factor N(5)-glutamine methyltransferase [Bacteroidales bacterium]|nr:peptide chain release factor N(5)-glutamine methyltransferase [Bacteroidales bacterium]
MEVRSNRIGDIRSFYRRKLCKVFEEKEADNMLFMVMMEFTGFSKAGILINHEQAVSESQLLQIQFAVKELLKSKPIQYVLGKTEFYGLPFIVNSKVLIPRPETEELVANVLEELKSSETPSVFDVGTGSGCIAITIKKKFPQTQVTAIDVSSFALEVAQKNATLNKTEINFEVCDFIDRKNWQDFEMFDIIVSNPPYVRVLEKAQMNKNVLEYEPDIALFVENNNPLVFYKGIAEFGQKHLNKGGMIFCEINQYLHNETGDLFQQHNYHNIKLIKDISDNFRILACIK